MSEDRAIENILPGIEERECFMRLASQISDEFEAGGQRALWSILSRMTSEKAHHWAELLDNKTSLRGLQDEQRHTQALKGILCIGIDKYEAGQWDSLDFCVSDARHVASLGRETLSTSDGVFLRENSDRSALWKAIEDFGDQVCDDAVHIIFYAGNGCQHEAEEYLVPRDATRFDDYVSVGAIMRMLDSKRKGCTFIICVAACRAFAEDEDAAVKALDRYNNKYSPNKFVISFACSLGQNVEEYDAALIEGISPYAYHLARLLPDLIAGDKVEYAMEQYHLNVRATQAKEDPWLYISHGAQSPSDTLSRNSSSQSSFRLSSRRRSDSHYSTFAVKASCHMQGVDMSIAEDIRKVWRKRVNRITVESDIKPSIIILTDTQGKSRAEVLDGFARHGMGAHFLIDRDGDVTQLVDPSMCAWCANPAYWGSGAFDGHGQIIGVGDVNEVHNHGISVALEGDGKTEEYSTKQYEKLVNVLRRFVSSLDIKPWNIVGLAEVCVPADRYDSPGRYFDWSKLVENGLTLQADAASHPDVSISDDPPRQLKAMMQEWGYSLGFDGDHNRGFRHRLSSFRDRYKVACPEKGFISSTRDVAAMASLLKKREAHLQSTNKSTNERRDARCRIT